MRGKKSSNPPSEEEMEDVLQYVKKHSPPQYWGASLMNNFDMILPGSPLYRYQWDEDCHNYPDSFWDDMDRALEAAGVSPEQIIEARKKFDESYKRGGMEKADLTLFELMWPVYKALRMMGYEGKDLWR